MTALMVYSCVTAMLVQSLTNVATDSLFKQFYTTFLP